MCVTMCVSASTCGFIPFSWLFFFFVTFGFVCFLINFILLSFLETRDREDVDQDGRGDGNELGGIGGEKTVIRIHCMEKVYFQLKKKP